MSRDGEPFITFYVSGKPVHSIYRGSEGRRCFRLYLDVSSVGRDWFMASWRRLEVVGLPLIKLLSCFPILSPSNLVYLQVLVCVVRCLVRLKDGSSFLTTFKDPPEQVNSGLVHFGTSSYSMESKQPFSWHDFIAVPAAKK